MRIIRLLFLSVLLVFGRAEGQELKLMALFSDHMVLQKITKIPLWGWDKAGSVIIVVPSWDHQAIETNVTKDGKWKLTIETPAAGGPFTITITGSAQITLQDVWIGEVWLASGQSNMSMPLKGYFCQPVTGSNEAILNSSGKHIHFINIPALAAYKPLDTINASWIAGSVATAGECCAIGWFFADFLQKHLGNVPVGIINSSFSGSSVEAWMPPAACKQFNDMGIPPVSNETSPWLNNVPTVLYNGMIHPLAGYAIKGVIWYQGESNIFNVPRYAPSVAAMIKEWRTEWGQGEFPFYFAEIAPYDYMQWNFFTPQWPEISAYLREAQRQSQKLIPNSAMAVLLDVGDEMQIHPAKKREAGERLALLALGKSYGVTGFETESPEFDHMEVSGDKAILHFSKQFMGLTSYEKPLELFEIAGENRVFIKAQAWIDGEKGTVVVTSPLVREPKAVRYAFKNVVKAELFGTGGLPVSSFRTDDW